MVPRFTDFYIPVLQVMSDVEPKEINQLMDEVADYLHLSEQDRNEKTGSGNQYRYRSNISWAVADLSQGNFIERVKRGHYVITIKGLELLEENPSKLDREYLAQRSESFKNFVERRGTRKPEVSAYERSKLERQHDLSMTKNIIPQKEKSTNLDELYNAIATLRKAGLPTAELENKISEMESDRLFDRLSEELCHIVKNKLSNVNRSVHISIYYHPGKDVEINIDKNSRINSIDDLSQKENDRRNKDNSYNEKINQHNDIKSKIVDSETVPLSNEKIKKVRKEEAPKSKGVWLKHYGDRTLILEGDTEPFADLLQSYGGVRMSDSKKTCSWMFMKNREDGLRKDLKDYIINDPNTTINNKSEKYQSGESDSVTGSNLLRDSEVSSSLINEYVNQLSNLRSFNFLGVTGPHKAILLITIFIGIRDGVYKENKIPYSQDLESTYNDLWKKYVGGTPTLGAVYPYMHLGKERFFTHRLLVPIRDFDRTWSRQKVDKHVDYAMLSLQLYKLLKNRVVCRMLIDTLVKKYCRISHIDTSLLNADALSFKHSLSESLSFDKSSNMILNISKETFRQYLSKTVSKHGRPYSSSSIGVYVAALTYPEISKMASQYTRSGDLTEIKDINVLKEISYRVEQAYLDKKIAVISKNAFNLYLEHALSILKSNVESKN